MGYPKLLRMTDLASRKGFLFIISGPAVSGKTISARLNRTSEGLQRIITTTTQLHVLEKLRDATIIFVRGANLKKFPKKLFTSTPRYTTTTTVRSGVPFSSPFSLANTACLILMFKELRRSEIRHAKIPLWLGRLSVFLSCLPHLMF